MKFRKIVNDISGINPIKNSFTIAKIGIKIFRTNYIKNKQIGIVPVNGYSSQRNHSSISDAWLDQQEIVHEHKIVREVKVGPYFFDGIIQENKKNFQFLGCYWHGCPCKDALRNEKLTLILIKPQKNYIHTLYIN